MKLKNLTATTEDRLSRFVDFINNINFDNYKYKSKYIQVKDDHGFYLSSHNPEMEEKIRDTIINLVKKYWKDFEAGIDFHRYDGDYLVEIVTESENKYNFVIEGLDDDFYCKFDSDFIVNL